MNIPTCHHPNGCSHEAARKCSTGGTANLAFTLATSAPTPVPDTAWAYTNYAFDPNHPHAASVLWTAGTCP